MNSVHLKPSSHTKVNLQPFILSEVVEGVDVDPVSLEESLRPVTASVSAINGNVNKHFPNMFNALYFFKFS